MSVFYPPKGNFSCYAFSCCSTVAVAGTQDLTHSDERLNDESTADVMDQADKFDEQSHDRQGSPSDSVILDDNDDPGDYADFAAATATALSRQDHCQPDQQQQMNAAFCTDPEAAVGEQILLSSATNTDVPEQDDDAKPPAKRSKFWMTGTPEGLSVKPAAQPGWQVASLSSTPQPGSQKGFVNSLLNSPAKAAVTAGNSIQGRPSHVLPATTKTTKVRPTLLSQLCRIMHHLPVGMLP